MIIVSSEVKKKKRLGKLKHFECDDSNKLY